MVDDTAHTAECPCLSFYVLCIVFFFLFLLFGRVLLVVAMRHSGGGRKFAESSWQLHYPSPG